MSEGNTQSTNEPQDDELQLGELSDEALDDLISTGSESSLGGWDRA